MTLRLLVLAVVAAVVVLGTLLHRQRMRRLQRVDTVPALPPELAGRSLERTWVLFSTPTCAVCDPAEQRLRTVDPAARIVRIDATQRPDLAEAMAVRTAPTLVLAGPDGRVTRRLAGPRAVMAHLGTLAPVS